MILPVLRLSAYTCPSWDPTYIIVFDSAASLARPAPSRRVHTGSPVRASIACVQPLSVARERVPSANEGGYSRMPNVLRFQTVWNGGLIWRKAEASRVRATL